MRPKLHQVLCRILELLLDAACSSSRIPEACSCQGLRGPPSPIRAPAGLRAPCWRVPGENPKPYCLGDYTVATSSNCLSFYGNNSKVSNNETRTVVAFILINFEKVTILVLLLLLLLLLVIRISNRNVVKNLAKLCFVL